MSARLIRGWPRRGPGGKEMKKLIVILAILMVGLTFTDVHLWAQEAESDPCEVGTFSLSVGAGMRNFKDNRYKSVYDTGGISYNIDLGVKIWKSLEVFLHTDYFSKDGELTFTGEDTTLKITPIELGARFLIKVNKDCRLKLFPYIGAGAGYYMIKEENYIGTFDEKEIGFFAEGGLRYYLMGSFFIDVKLKNVFLKVEDDQGNKMDTGGFTYMGGIGISF
jgi:hypothetical protein